MRLGLLTIALLLAACAVEIPAVVRKSPGPSLPKASAGTGASTGASATPTPQKSTPAGGGSPSATPTTAAGLPSPTVTPTAGSLAMLGKPKSPSTLISGQVRLDASFLVAAGAGNVMSHNGGLIVAAGAGNIVSHNGGLVLSHNGSQIVAAGAGNVISHNGGVMVAAGAGNLVAAGAGNLVAAGAGNYRLAQAETPAAGTQLPAAGMELRAFSLRDGKPLPIGVGPDDQPVYGIFTNTRGEYQIYLPASEVGNVRLEARVPTSRDVRLTYDTLTDTRAAAAGTAAAKLAIGKVIDEDTALATRYLRRCLVGRMVEIWRSPDTKELQERIASDWGEVGEAVRKAVATLVTDYRAVAEEAGLNKASEAECEVVAARVLDIALAHAELDGVVASKSLAASWEDEPDAPALAAMVGVLAHARAKSGEQLAANAKVFDTWPFSATAKRFPPDWRPRKASDPTYFIVEEYLTSNETGAVSRARTVFTKIGANKPLPGARIDQADRLHGAAIALLLHLASLAVYDDEVREANFKAMRTWRNPE